MSAPSLSLIGLFHTMIPFVCEVFNVSAEGGSIEGGLTGKPWFWAPTSLLARVDLPELQGPTKVTIDSF